jgi:hypothetical protein
LIGDANFISLAIELAKARKAHEEHKSDPSRNVGTGQALYAAEQGFGAALDGLMKLSPEALTKLMTVEKRAEASEARALELEQRFPVSKCPQCGTFGRRGHSHVHGFVMGSHVKYESCDGLNELLGDVRSA